MIANAIYTRHLYIVTVANITHIIVSQNHTIKRNKEVKKNVQTKKQPQPTYWYSDTNILLCHYRCLRI